MQKSSELSLVTSCYPTLAVSVVKIVTNIFVCDTENICLWWQLYACMVRIAVGRLCCDFLCVRYTVDCVYTVSRKKETKMLFRNFLQN